MISRFSKGKVLRTSLLFLVLVLVLLLFQLLSLYQDSESLYDSGSSGFAVRDRIEPDKSGEVRLSLPGGYVKIKASSIVMAVVTILVFVSIIVIKRKPRRK